jgi:preprotein translocase subunit YajC
MDMLTSFLPMAAIFVVFYFLLIRPQQKRAREQKDLLAALEKGNEVISTGGIVGRITKINEQYVTLEVTTGVEMTIQRSAIAQLLPKGTLKSL